MNTGQLFFDNIAVETLIFCRSTDSISTTLDDEAIILNISKGLYSSLDPVGTSIWDALEVPSTFQQISDRILSEYDVTREQCAQDLLLFLKELRANKLIVVKSDVTIE